MKKLDFTGSSKARHRVRPSSSDNLEVMNVQDMLDRYEKEIIETTLNRYQWHRLQVAAILGINRKTLFKKMIKYGLKKPLKGAK
jgi:DNA-binding NtrC family response regulator